MKKRIFSFILFLLPLEIFAFPSELIIIGNSFSDSGNQGLTIAGFHSPNTNGTTWPVFLAEALGVERLLPYVAGGTNYAYSGALTLSDFNPSLGAYVPSMTTQLDLLPPNLSKKNPIFIFGGGNDYLAILPALPTPIDQPATNIVNIAQNLHERGYKYLTVLNFFDVVRVPFPFLSEADNLILAEGIFAFNTALQQQLQAKTYPVLLIDTFSLFQSIGDDPGRYGFFNVTSATPPDSSSWGYLWWYDGIHPTEGLHFILSDYVSSILAAPCCFMSLSEMAYSLLKESTSALRTQLYPAQQLYEKGEWYAFVDGTYTPLLEPASASCCKNGDSDGGNILLGFGRQLSSKWNTGLAGSYTVNNSACQQNRCKFQAANETLSLFATYCSKRGYVDTMVSAAFVQFDDIKPVIAPNPHAIAVDGWQLF